MIRRIVGERIGMVNKREKRQSEREREREIERARESKSIYIFGTENHQVYLFFREVVNYFLPLPRLKNFFRSDQVRKCI